MAATLLPLTENEIRRSIVGYKQRCMLACLDKAAPRDDRSERPRWVESRRSSSVIGYGLC